MSLQRLCRWFRTESSDLPIRSSSSGSGGSEIPEDLLIEILLRVPAKSVTKFRRLSKFHRDWIDSPDFKLKHYNVSIRRRTSCSHIIVVSPETDYQVVRLDSTEFGARVERCLNSFKGNGYSIVDSCVGIVCLLLSPEAGRDGHILVWNPLTGGRRMIDEQYDINFSSYYYLGHDAATDDLKILKIRRNSSESHCEIYSCRIGSRRKICDINKRLIFILWRHRIFVEGTSSLHTVDPTDESIVAFDFSLEKFNRIGLPERPGDPYQCSLLDLDGCLGIGNYGIPCEASCTCPCWSVWRMKEYGVEESWSWLFCVRDFVPTSFWPASASLQFVNGGRQLLLLWADCGQYEVGLYDFEEEKLIKYEEKETIAWLDCPPTHFLYIPSLMQVGPEYENAFDHQTNRGLQLRRSYHINRNLVLPPQLDRFLPGDGL